MEASRGTGRSASVSGCHGSFGLAFATCANVDRAAANRSPSWSAFESIHTDTVSCARPRGEKSFWRSMDPHSCDLEITLVADAAWSWWIIAQA
ncbi:hypothetical protein VTO73DRAFT_4981 [Trametes versicolor]